MHRPRSKGGAGRGIVALMVALAAVAAAPRIARAAVERPVMVAAPGRAWARERPVQVTIQKRHQLWSGYFSGFAPSWSGRLQPGAIYSYTSAPTSRYEAETLYFIPARGRSSTYCLYVEVDRRLSWRGLAWPAWWEYYGNKAKYGYRAPAPYATLCAARKAYARL